MNFKYSKQPKNWAKIKRINIAKANPKPPKPEPRKKMEKGHTWKSFRKQILTQLKAIDYREKHGEWPKVSFDEIKPYFTAQFILSTAGISLVHRYRDYDILLENSKQSLKRIAWLNSRRTRKMSVEKKVLAAQMDVELEPKENDKQPDSKTEQQAV